MSGFESLIYPTLAAGSPGETKEILVADGITILLQGRDVTTGRQSLTALIFKFIMLSLGRSKLPACLSRVLRHRRARHIHVAYKF